MCHGLFVIFFLLHLSVSNTSQTLTAGRVFRRISMIINDKEQLKTNAFDDRKIRTARGEYESQGENTIFKQKSLLLFYF